MKLWEHTKYDTCDEWVFLRVRGVWRVLVIRQKDDYLFDMLKPGFGRDDSALYFTSPRWLVAV
jgi:hypothetical protein